MRSHKCNIYQRFLLNDQIPALHISRLIRSIWETIYGKDQAGNHNDVI